MNNRDTHIVNSLRRWIQGDVTQKEESQLEREAREDLFLQEALEGYRRFPESRHQQRLDRMREQLQSKPRKRGALLISMPYRIAAASAVVLTIGLFWLLNPGPPQELAESAAPAQSVETDQRVAEKPTLTENTPIISATEETAKEVQEPAAAEEVLAFRDDQPQDALADRQEQEAPQVYASRSREDLLSENRKSKASSEIAVVEKPQLRANPNPVVVSPGSTPSQPPVVTIPPSELDKVAAPTSPSHEKKDFPVGGVNLGNPTGVRLITGKVMDSSGTPLNGVLVVSPGDRTGTITNLNGQYEILLDSGVQKLEFQRTGYHLQRVDLPENGGVVQVTLDEAAPTVDKVLAKEEASKKRKKNKSSAAVTGLTSQGNIAAPLVGYKRFENYLQLNLNYPELALENDVSGEVVLSFTIEPDGTLSNVRALQGPGYGLEQEAIRLIQGGSKWKIANGGQGSINFIYRMRFSL